jgi:hypothetical protein
LAVGINRQSTAGCVWHRHPSGGALIAMPNHRSSVMMLPKPSAEERTMTPKIKSHPIISKLIDAFGNWRKHRQEIRDLYDDEFSTFAK